MGFIPQITCRHCGKKFSAIHGRCPHCGARKVKSSGTLPPKTAQAPGYTARPEQPSRTGASSARPKARGMAAGLFQANTRWQFLFGCILIVLVIVAVIVLISTSLAKKAPDPVETPEPPVVEVTTPPPTTPPPTPSPEPTIPVSSVAITFLGELKTEFTQRIEWAPIQLKAEVYPLEAAAETGVVWRSSDESVLTVSSDGLVTAVASGQAEVIAECGGVAASCRVWVP